MAWRLADPYGTQGQGSWWQSAQPGTGLPGDDVPYVGSPLSSGLGRGLFGGSFSQPEQPALYQQQQSPQAAASKESTETAPADPLPNVSYQSVLNCFTLSYLNSHHKNKDILIRLLPTLPITPGVHSRDPEALPTGASASRARGRSRSHDRGESNTFRSVADAEQWRAGQLVKNVGVDPRFDWDAFPLTVGWRVRGEVRSLNQVGSDSAEGRDSDTSAGENDEIYSPSHLQLDEIPPSPTHADGEKRIHERQLADSASRRGRTSNPSGTPKTTRSMPRSTRSVTFVKHLENAETAPTIISNYLPYCIALELDDVVALRQQEERDAMNAAGFGLGGGAGNATGVERSRYNPRGRENAPRYAGEQPARAMQQIPVVSQWAAPAVSGVVSEFFAQFGYGFASASSNTSTSKSGNSNGTSDINNTGVLTRAAHTPAHKEKQPVKPALSRFVARWRARGRAAISAAQGVLDRVRGASVGVSAAITGVAESASADAGATGAAGSATEGLPEREQEHRRAQPATINASSAANASPHETSASRARSIDHSSRPSMPSRDREPVSAARPEEEYRTRPSMRSPRRREAVSPARSDDEADGDRFYRAPVSRRRESSESSEDGFQALSRQKGKQRRERDGDNDRDVEMRTPDVTSRRSSWSSDSQTSDRRSRPKPTTIVLATNRDRHLDGSPPRVQADALDTIHADDQGFDQYRDDEYEEDPTPVVDLPAIGSVAATPMTRGNTAFNAAQLDFVPLEDDKTDQGAVGSSRPATGSTIERANQRWQSGYSNTDAYFRSLSSFSDNRGRGPGRQGYAPATAGDSWVNDESDTDSADERRRSRRVRLRSPPPPTDVERMPKVEDGESRGTAAGPGTAANPAKIEDEDMDDIDEKTLHSWEARLHATLQKYTKRYEVPEYDDETDSEDENPDFAGIEEDSDAEMRVEAEEVPELGVKPLYGLGFNRDRTLPKFTRPKLKDFEDRHRGYDRGNQYRYGGQDRYQPYRRR